ncbi:PP2C family protein-serine/threonine phosphatase [Algirhabdus cladophorae]|uniref:PP2C family protein-serine/threonine phosphatase n=1 Tax=Algirhabdus cladophorae TaxID=3377108 RepID=UPI003B846ED5
MSAIATNEVPETVDQQPLRVLVVDDSRLQRRILSASLKKWNYSVQEADSGESALALCHEQSFDLILSDWMMPGISGLDLCVEFRKLENAQYAYFILLTSKSEKNEIARGLEVGADDFLTKPFDSTELHARIRAGERILKMHEQLAEKNREISLTLNELQSVYTTLDNDLREAKKLQQSLVPVRFQEFGPSNVAAILKSCGHVGGDLVGFFEIDANQIGLFSIDVSGHGMSSALMTARLAGYLSAANPTQNIALDVRADGTIVPRRPSVVAEDFNNLIFSEIETEHYFTLIYAVVNLETGVVDFTQAGHPHPAVLAPDGTVEFHGTGGLPIGLIEDATFDDMQLQLRRGDRLFLASDGITEAQDLEGTLLEDEGLAQILTQNRQSHGNSLLEAIVWDLTDYAANGEFDDDVSAVLFEYNHIPK